MIDGDIMKCKDAREVGAEWMYYQALELLKQSDTHFWRYQRNNL
jgi:hypothetical protein